MRIGLSDTIKITGRITRLNFLRRLKKGAEIPARIVKRHNSRIAILEIAGNRLRADFLKGVPGNNRLTLRLEDNSNNSYTFKLIDSISKNDLLSKIFEITVFKVEDIDKNNILYINRFLNRYSGRNPTGIFELNNLLLSQVRKEKKKGEGITHLLNRLLKRGMSKENLLNLAVILSGIRINSDIISPFLLIFGFDQNYFEKRGVGKQKRFEEKIEEALSEINKIINAKKKDDIVSALIDLIVKGNGESDKTICGELAFFDNEEFRPINYMRNESSFLFSLELSNLGTIDILAKKISENISISIFSDNNDVLEALGESLDLLSLRLKNAGLSGYENSQISINLYNRRDILEKLIEINSNYFNISEFDIKV